MSWKKKKRANEAQSKDPISGLYYSCLAHTLMLNPLCFPVLYISTQTRNGLMRNPCSACNGEVRYRICHVLFFSFNDAVMSLPIGHDYKHMDPGVPNIIRGF